jgi:hypothetical protein
LERRLHPITSWDETGDDVRLIVDLVEALCWLLGRRTGGVMYVGYVPSAETPEERRLTH